MLEQLQESGDHEFWRNILPGNLNTHMYSLHIFEGDIPILKYRLKGGHDE